MVPAMTWRLVALIVPLGLDTFAVCAALGMAGLPRRQRLRVSALMTAFEAGMPVVGLALGAPLGHVLGDAADYVAAAVLIAAGLYMVLAEDDEQEGERLASLHGWGAVALGISISLDELAIGFTLGLLRVPVVLVVALIAAQAFVMSQLGLRLGARISGGLREGAEKLAGVVLVGLGAVLVIEALG
jgi:putative Mn2+ efflux pump MntP